MVRNLDPAVSIDAARLVNIATTLINPSSRITSVPALTPASSIP